MGLTGRSREKKSKFVLEKVFYRIKTIEMNWYSLYTKPRNEKKVAQGLEAMGIEVYCPMVTQVRQWSDRKKKVELPLIPSYVFVRVPDAKRAMVFEVPGVVRYLYWLGQPATITDTEIESLRNALRHTVENVEIRQYEPGQKITIPSGAFVGQHAEIQEVRGNKVVLVLENLGIKVVLQINE